MSNFSKILIVILIVLSFFYIREKCGININNILSSVHIPVKFELPSFNKEKDKTKEQPVKEPVEIVKPSTDNQEKMTAEIYFLALDSNDNGIYKKVKRIIPSGNDKLEFAIKELLKGPNVVEKTTGTYSEIPKNTKLLSIKQTDSKVIINFNSDFQYGGGTDSIYSRMMQLIKTSIANTENKKIYLYLDGKQINFIGGEGIMVSQPLTEKSLEI